MEDGKSLLETFIAQTVAGWFREPSGGPPPRQHFGGPTRTRNPYRLRGVGYTRKNRSISKRRRIMARQSRRINRRLQ